MNTRNPICYLVFASLLFSSCIKKYKRTSNVCKNTLYVEVFNINPAGVDAVYLTDSINFRLYVGEFDNEHENFSCYCNGDSIVIKKLATVDTSGRRKAVQTRTFSLKTLQENKTCE